MFMRGKDGKNLEESILEKFAELDKISRVVKKNEENIRKIKKKIKKFLAKTFLNEVSAGKITNVY